MYVVICRSDREGRKAGRYVLATRTVFSTFEDAEAYRKTCSKSRQPIAVEGRFDQLRTGEPNPFKTGHSVQSIVE